MPEGDTVHLTAARLERALAGQVLTRTDFRVPSIATVDLAGRRVIDVGARGKHLLFRVEGDTTIHSHLKMEGVWYVFDNGARWNPHDHRIRAILQTGDRTAVGMRLGLLEVVPTAREQVIVGHLGPDPLADDWDERAAVRRVTERAGERIADVLLDQRAIAGPGNIYRCEVMFLRGLHPEARVTGRVDVEGLVKLVARLMQANRTTGMQITTGHTRPGRRHWVYGRGGEPCRRCGTPIARRAEAPGVERVTYWCPRCQPEDADHLRASAPNGSA